MQNNSNNEEIYVPRFSLKKFKNSIFTQFEPNKEYKYDRELMILAMSYGMILKIQYRGADDSFVFGRARKILPLVIGTSAKGKPLLRAYHLNGWSFSKNGNTEKIWRMFRTDRILSMSFTGDFFRLVPEDYNSADRGMRGGITKAVDIEEVRNNQKKLLEEGSIQNKKESELTNKDVSNKNPVVVEALNSNSVFDLNNPFGNKNLENEKSNAKQLRLTFLAPVEGSNKPIVILGALGKSGNIVKISSSGKYLGKYKVLKSLYGDSLGKPHLRDIRGIKEFDLHIYVKKSD